jgi:large subunit ribosomal protein L17
MRHRQAGRKLGRTMAHREMMMRNLVTSLVLYEKIITTAAKAKELRSVAEKMVTLAKREDLHARRQAAEVLNDEKALKKLFDTIGARFRERSGGYTRITKLDYRMGDGAPLAAIEFLGVEPAPELKGKTKEKASQPAEGGVARSGRRRRRRRGKRAGTPAEAASAAGSEG